MKSLIVKIRKLKFNKNNFYVLIFYFIFVNLLYFSLYFTYFQQDEWYGFGQAIVGLNNNFSNLFGVLGGYHFTPLSSLLYFIEYYIFGLNSAGFAFVSIQLHVVATFLVYIFSKSLLRNGKYALLASLIFSVANAPSQAVTWFAASSIEYATIFALCSIIFWLKSFDGKNMKLMMFLSMIFLFLGLLFKEDIITLFAVLPILSIYKYGIKKQLKPFISLIILGVIYIIPRLVLQNSNASAIQIHTVQSFYNFLSVTILNARVFITGLGFTILSSSIIIVFLKTVVFGYLLSKLTGGFITIPDSVTEIFFTPLIAGILSILTVVIFTFLVWKNKKYITFKQEFLLLLTIPISFFPYIFLGRDIILPESRYFYYPMIFVSIFLSLMVYFINNYFKGKKTKVFLSILLISFLFINIHYDTKISNYIPLSNTRKKVINDLNAVVSNKESKVIYYISGDPLPFQSGIGQMLVVLSTQKNKNLNPFLENYYLWNMGSQGYKEIKSLGIGYFYDYTEMKKTYLKYNLKPQNVIALKWDGVNSQMRNITEQTRKLLISNEE